MTPQRKICLSWLWNSHRCWGLNGLRKGVKTSSPWQNVVTFAQTFMENCTHIVDIGLNELQKRNTERDQFFTCVQEATEANRQAGIAKVEAFVTFKKQVGKCASVLCCAFNVLALKSGIQMPIVMILWKFRARKILALKKMHKQWT